MSEGLGARIQGCWHFTEMCCGTEAGSYLRLIGSCITQHGLAPGGGAEGHVHASRGANAFLRVLPRRYRRYSRLIDLCITQL